jgi:hypothetical protein
MAPPMRSDGNIGEGRKRSASNRWVPSPAARAESADIDPAHLETGLTPAQLPFDLAVLRGLSVMLGAIGHAVRGAELVEDHGDDGA